MNERVLGDRAVDASGNEMVQSVQVDRAQVPEKRNLEPNETLYSKMKDQVVQNLLDCKNSVEQRTESDDEDEEDVDFNPFLQRSPSPEASSGLSSENEDLDEENGITEGDNLERCEGDAFQSAKGKVVVQPGSENDNEEVQDDEEEEDENSEEETEEDDKDGCMEQVLGNIKAMVELGSENDDEEVADNEEEEDAKNEEDTDRDGPEPGNLNIVTLARHGNDAIVGLDNGDLEEGAQAGCKSKMLERTASEQHETRMCALELDKEGTIPQQTEVEMTFAVLSDLRSSPGKLKQTLQSQKDQSDEEEQVVDAICKRTRAQYSLADMSLDELETFLQGSDEEDYFQNVDDEEEYRKFVAAVQGRLDDGTGGNDQDGGKEEEEDEEDDYDFELEIEEALESDHDERLSRKSKRRASGRRPEKRRHVGKPKERLLGLAKVPLRPLLPLIARKDSFVGANKISEESSRGKPAVNGFTADQIRQLQCLIHEHVQLLVQVFSLSVLEPSRQQTAVDTHRLLMQLVETCNEVVSWKKTAFPHFYFCPPCVLSSTSFEKDDNCFQPDRPKFQTSITDWRSSFNANAQSLSTSGQSIATGLSDRGALTSSNNVYPNCNSVVNQTTNDSGACVSLLPPTAASMSCLEQSSSCLSRSQRNLSMHPKTPSQSEGFVSQRAIGPSPSHLPPNTVACVIDQGNCVPRQKTGWAPVVSGPVYSLLDVPPLALVKDFLADVDQAVQDYRQHHILSGTYHGKCGWEPLFPSSITSLYQVAHPDLSESEWTMAAPLAEAPQKKKIALVPKEISIAVGRFAPFFNPDLFPHQPPPAVSANRILFTEAEDILLAMGLMRYNTNWNAIQQNLLPSKTTHQIFVRQKNRSSGRAPENSIKAVRRFKASPLTKEEKDCIEEGLNLYKLDWMKVWEYCVPHRDPATLPRQWRVAVGTQEYHKTCGKAKGKHNISEAKRQQEKQDVSTTVLQDGDAGEVNNGDETCGANDVNSTMSLSAARIPGSCQSTSAILPVAAHHDTVCNLSCTECKVQETRSEEGSVLQKNVGQRHLVNCSVVQNNLGKVHLVHPSPPGGQSQPASAWTLSRRPSTYVTSGKSTSDFLRKHHNSWSYRSSKKGVQTVKLAPGLPSLNLPPCVRVIPQSKLDISHPFSSKNYSNVISQCKCFGSSRNQKCSLAVPSGASSRPSKPVPGSKTDLLFSETNSRELKHVENTNAGNDQSMPCKKSKCGRISPRYGWSAGLKENGSSCKKFVGSFKVPNSCGANSISEVQRDCVIKPPGVKVHPLLMQCSFGSEALSKGCCRQMQDGNVNVRECQCNVFVGKSQQPLLQQGIVNTGQNLFHASSSANASIAVGSAELHPFLQEEDEHQPFLISQVRGMTPLSAKQHNSGFPITGGRVGVMQQPSVSVKSNLRPAPLRAMTQQQGEHLERARGPIGQSPAISSCFHKAKRHKSAHNMKIPVQKLVRCKKKSKGRSGLLDPDGEEISTNIVMEQEELSDSDDEMEEGVQFECEEMVDSDREGSDHEQHVSEPDEEDEGIKFEEEEIGSDDSDNGGGKAGRCDSSV